MSREQSAQASEGFSFENDPIFGALRESAPGPDVSASVLDEVERRGVFASVRMRRAIGIARLGALALGVGMLGGLLVAKRYSPEAAIFPAAQAPATRVLEEGCDRAARNAGRIRAMFASEAGERGLFTLRQLDGVTRCAEFRARRDGVAPPSSAVVIALWSTPTDRRLGLACARSGALELWLDSDRAERAQRLVCRMQALAPQCPSGGASFDESVGVVLAANRSDNKQ